MAHGGGFSSAGVTAAPYPVALGGSGYALARGPGVLLLDEPLSALDARTRAGAARELGAVLGEVEVPSLLVTHDFSEAAQLGDRVGVIDAGRVVQEGSPSELAAEPRSAFVADFTGAIVLTGVAGAGPDGLTRVALDGGGEATSTDSAEGPVAVSVYPWEITIEPPAEAAHGSARNRLAAEVISAAAARAVTGEFVYLESMTHEQRWQIKLHKTRSTL